MDEIIDMTTGVCAVSTAGSPPAVAILLATYNGAENLRAQLQSYVDQSVRPGLVLISDDGSVDDTRQIIAGFSAEHPDLNIVLKNGPRRGAAQNFMSLLCQTPDWVDIVALSDQDDVWLPQKLERGVQALSGQTSQCQLYCGRTWECDEQLNKLRLSRGLKRPAGFRHALVQNVAGGNTMMLNRTAITLVQEACEEARKVVVHDWWIYQIITGTGGEVIFDTDPQTLYRQHQGNLIGANRGLQAKKKRLLFLVSGRFRRWNTINIHALRASRDRLTPENRRTLECFATERNLSVFRRIGMIRRIGLYRQGISGTLSLYLAALLRRL